MSRFGASQTSSTRCLLAGSRWCGRPSVGLAGSVSLYDAGLIGAPVENKLSDRPAVAAARPSNLVTGRSIENGTAWSVGVRTDWPSITPAIDSA